MERCILDKRSLKGLKFTLCFPACRQAGLCLSAFVAMAVLSFTTDPDSYREQRRKETPGN
jgi:hypothetical protein